ncbi:hypothetical protein SAMN04487911_13329 [Arenibacter nanhaiticus]|uniref:Uncharacterized protein n=1 Tax=Arenibacter nanhaiticus TaxID=558155 RepID=A0A1M6LRT4_9FLAO|nr:hypothetical protein SAMN04487911_13329 [Arenibacter nanhaiticus]
MKLPPFLGNITTPTGLSTDLVVTIKTGGFYGPQVACYDTNEQEEGLMTYNHTID